MGFENCKEKKRQQIGQDTVRIDRKILPEDFEVKVLKVLVFFILDLTQYVSGDENLRCEQESKAISRHRSKITILGFLIKNLKCYNFSPPM